MPAYNRVILAGNVTRQPELKTTPKGTAVCQFGLAINRHYTTEDGQKREEVTFLDCKSFGRQAETLGKYVGKGSALLVEGRITQEEWTDKATGEKRRATRILVETFQFLGQRPTAVTALEAASTAPIHETRSTDDVPF